MSGLYRSNSSEIIRLKEQPHFPAEDLSGDNRDMLLHMLSDESGVDAMASALEYHQQFVYSVAQAGLAKLGHQSKFNEVGLQAFSRGFAGFEAISDLVHKPSIYNVSLAASQVARYLVDTRPHIAEERSDDIDPSTKSILNGLVSDQDVRDDPQLEYLLERLNPEQDVEADEKLLEQDYPSTEIPKDILRELSDSKRRELQITDRHKPEAEQMYADRHSIFYEEFPNTYEVLATLGLRHGEKPAEIQARMAGAQLARTMQTLD